MSKLKANYHKVQCPCGKFFRAPNHLYRRGLARYCCRKHYWQYRDKFRQEKVSLCQSCGRQYLIKIGCLYCKEVGNLTKL